MKITRYTELYIKRTIALSPRPLTKMGVALPVRCPAPNCPSAFRPKVKTRPESTNTAEWVGPIAMSTTRCLPRSLSGVGSSDWVTWSWVLLRIRLIWPMKVWRLLRHSLLYWLLEIGKKLLRFISYHIFTRALFGDFSVFVYILLV